MTDKTRYTDWVFWFQWMIVTIVGWALAGWRLGNIFVSRAEVNTLIYDLFLIPLVFGPLSGILIGTAQWLILRHRLPHSKWWILATFVGSIIGTIAYFVESLQVSEGSWMLHGAEALVLGTSIGTAQWYGLHTLRVSRAGWWILASGLGYFAMFVVSSLFIADSTPGYWVSATLQGAVAGALTGITLVWLIREPLTNTQVERGGSDLTTPWVLSATFGAITGFVVSILPVGVSIIFFYILFFNDCGYSTTKCPSDNLLSGYILLTGIVASPLIGGLIGGWRRYQSNQTDQAAFRGGMIGGFIGIALWALAFIIALF